jgi:3-oxoacyl-[acyl-carrier protein] reductase
MTQSTFQPISKLDGKVAVIVGGAGAIGIATARHFAALGARVALVHRDTDPARTQPILDSLHGGGHQFYTASVIDSESLKQVAAQIQNDMGAIHILVNSAGFTQPVPLNDLDALSDELIDSIFQVNWRGVFATIRAFTPWMKKAQDPVIINVSSIAAFTGVGSNLAYAAAKAGTDLMTKALAKALSPELRVVGISPGVVNTSFVPGRGPEFNQKAASTTPLRRVGEAEDVAQAIVALTTTLAFTTGTTLVVDGGRHLVS